jgi:hypothetical protein
MTNVIRLPGNPQTAREMVSKLLELVDHIDGLYVVITWKDGATQIANLPSTPADMCMAGTFMTDTAIRWARGELASVEPLGMGLHPDNQPDSGQGEQTMVPDGRGGLRPKNHPQDAGDAPLTNVVPLKPKD